METEDDMFVVIVGDEADGEGDTNYFPESIKIKEEVLDDSESNFAVEDLIEKAEKHGERINVDDLDIKLEPEDHEQEHLDDESFSFIEGIDDEDWDDDEYIPDAEEYSEDEKIRNKHRKTMLKPWQQKSFVNELRKNDPSLKKNERKLVEKLAQIMRNTKPPPLPQEFYINNYDKMKCIKCNTVTESVPAAGRHYQEKHGERYLVCFACGVDFRSKTNLYKHEKRCTASDALIVLKARAQFLGRKGRSRPFLPKYDEATKRQGLNRCQLCPAVFQSKTALVSHGYMHDGVRPFQCDVCPSAYTSLSALSRHRKKHSDEQYVCDHCGRVFKVKVALVAHMDTHLPQRKHGCEECGQRFAQKSALRLHVDRAHRHLPPPCACQICPNRYPRMSVLKAHMRRAHGMLLMTRKMFFTKLPSMTETQLQQAKIVFKSDEAAMNNNLVTERLEQKMKPKEDKGKTQLKEEESVEQVEELGDQDLSEDFLNYIKTIQETTDKDVNIVVIQNGDLDSVENYKTKLMVDIETVVGDSDSGQVFIVQNSKCDAEAEPE